LNNRTAILIVAIPMSIRLILPFLFALTICAAIPTELQNAKEVQGLSTTNSLYISNKAPLAANPFTKLPIGSITPKGWLRTQLELEASGMTGHLEEISKWCRFEGNAWVSPTGEGHSGWEELPYWLKGYGDLGYVLRDENIINNARKWIDGVLSTQEEDGYFGHTWSCSTSSKVSTNSLPMNA
jgi:hypothetical protein